MTMADMTCRTSTVLIVDDHPFMRSGLAQMINDLPGMEVFAEAEGREDALAQLQHRQPDVAVIDISLPDGNGIELVKEIKTRWPDVKMLVSSMHDETLFADRTIRAGALGYINKSADVDTYVIALRQVRQGQVYLSDRMTNRFLVQFTARNPKPADSPVHSLSNRELEVFDLIGRSLTTKQIAARLDLSRKTVETYREHIKLKLNLSNGAELTCQAVQWVLEQA
jgi:DNA-binding NarL/FixJ family response regulator